MDSITQAALGAAVGEAMLGKKIGRQAALLGAVGGTIPDLDVFLTFFYDSLEKISIHRGYSHSILFCLIGAFLFGWLLKKIKATKPVSFSRLWLFSFLTLFTHVLLDAFTTYGTQLFLPFTDKRVSFDSVNIVDPFYTLPLLIGVLGSVFYYKKENEKCLLPNTIGLVISSLYLLFTLANKQHIEQIFNQSLQDKNISYSELLTVPVFIGNVNWYGVAKDENYLYLGKYSMLNDEKISFDKFSINDHLLDKIDPHLADRMRWFSQGFYVVAEDEGITRVYNMQCDMQGIRHFGDYKAPTAFYFEITPKEDGSFDLKTGMHPQE